MIRRFLALVPRPVQVTALALAVVETLAGFLVGTFWQNMTGMPADSDLAAHTAAIGFGLGLLLAFFSGLWVLCLGWVYRDSQRRMMRAWLWVLVAVCIPHLLGFLLYFLLRQPIAAYCVHCGVTISSAQRYCPWCGKAQTATPGSPVQPGLGEPGPAQS